MFTGAEATNGVEEAEAEAEVAVVVVVVSAAAAAAAAPAVRCISNSYGVTVMPAGPLPPELGLDGEEAEKVSSSRA